MSSPAHAYSAWSRRRRSSASSHGSHEGRDTFVTAPSPSQHLSNDGRILSSSVGSVSHREPIRSFIHGSIRGNLPPIDSAESARCVREDTAELAHYILSDKDSRGSPFLRRQRSVSSQPTRQRTISSTPNLGDMHGPVAAGASSPIAESSEPPSPWGSFVAEGRRASTAGAATSSNPSMLTTMFKKSPPPRPDVRSYFPAPPPRDDQVFEENLPPTDDDDVPSETGSQETLTRVSTVEHRPLFGDRDAREAEEEAAGETSPLLAFRSRESRGSSSYGSGNGLANGHNGAGLIDLEGQKHARRRGWFGRTWDSLVETKDRVKEVVPVVVNPKRWNRYAMWESIVVAPMACLPAVVVGLLLNILDALSYGMILFPLGRPIFANLGSVGISMFYVSCIISQLTFSFGSIFKGGVGSELIEVVPFFHNMAATITDIVGEDDPEAVIATTISSYALSCMLTGAVFFLMGKFKVGYLVGFIPRHILIGCIGGVGYFLIATGFEVTARLDGNLEYNLETLKRLLQANTVPLWIIPLVLAVILFYGQSKITSKYFLPLYILAIPAAFYAVAAAMDVLDPETLRDGGWVFQGPPAGEPWWHFYTLYKFHKIHWGAIVHCIPAMFALTFFGILHVPINVPALALNTGEDHADLNHELKLHGYSNLFSGMAGSIQNYLVYSNSLFFMRSGGDTRLAGFELALFTFLVMIMGPGMIGYIPVMMVGVLIFDLGFELLLEAVWQPRKKLKTAEYLTVIVIVLVMGTYDFVVGIGVGILLAFVSLIFQTSRISAVRASYSGDVVGSTVRRNPTQQHYLRQVGRQINILKLSGYLFFGTIVGVEDKIRALITEEAFNRHPIKFLILDLWLVTGLDYSAAEVFNTISRLCNSKDIELVISGVDAERGLGRNLRAVGLGEDGIEVKLLPDLNSALEYCENELLKTLYANLDDDTASTRSTSTVISGANHLDVPDTQHSSDTNNNNTMLGTSPRRVLLREAARASLHHSLEAIQHQYSRSSLSKWQSFSEPLRLMLQIFRDVSDKNEDFWFRAVPYFKRYEHSPGTVLFRRGEPADGFYLVEAGILRAEYDLPQGMLFESIVAGTTCGELPFFSETERTATCVVEDCSGASRRHHHRTAGGVVGDGGCVVWKMDREAWERMQREEPDVAQELLRIGLKLTSERMSVITSYTLTMAG